MPRTCAPLFPRLMAAPGPKCMHRGPSDHGREPLVCVKPEGHDARHLHDVHPRRVDPKYLHDGGLVACACGGGKVDPWERESSAEHFYTDRHASWVMGGRR